MANYSQWHHFRKMANYFQRHNFGQHYADLMLYIKEEIKLLSKIIACTVISLKLLQSPNHHIYCMSLSYICSFMYLCIFVLVVYMIEKQLN